MIPDIPFTKADNKLAILLAVALAFVLALAGGYVWGSWGEYDKGVQAERAKWLGLELQRKEAERLAIDKRNKENDAIRDGQQKHNWMVVNDYEKRIETLRREAADDLAAVRRAGGLRVTRAVCDSPAGPAPADRPASNHEAAAGTVALPQQVEDDLWSAALHSDEIVEQARACQAWITKQGFKTATE